MTIDKSLDEWFRAELRKSRRSILNKVKADKSRKLANYLWQRFPMLQDKKYTNGMRLHWLEAGYEDFPACACKDGGVHQNKSAKCGISGYTSPYCSNECALKEGLKNAQKTKEERYGDPNYRNPDKAAKTNLKRYGVVNPFQSKAIIGSIQEKRKQKGPSLMQKAWKTRKENSTEKFAQFSYNDKIFLQFLDVSPLKTFEVRAYTNEERKMYHLKIKQYLHFLEQDMKPEFTVEEWIACQDPTTQPMKWTCKEGHHFEACINKHYHTTDNLRCPVCMPYLDVGTSKKEQDLQQLVERLLPGAEVQKNTREVIKPLELDVYIPSLSIALEFDGLYSHCDAFKKPRYHIMKTTRCDNLGIQLVHVFEDEWDSKWQLCESMIAQVLGKSEVHNAKDLQLKTISSEEADSFAEQNHILGAKCSKHETCYGLFDSESKLLFACAIDHLKANKHEVVYMCSKMNHHVHGGLDACMQSFCSQFNPSYVCCKLDRRWHVMSSLHDCSFFNGYTIEKSRFSYVSYGCTFRICPEEVTDDFLKKQKTYDPKKTAEENLVANKFTKIWDAGRLVLTWKRNIYECNKGVTEK